MSGDVSRRAFLGAAAAVWNLPWSDQLRLYTDADESQIPGEPQESGYPSERTRSGFAGSVLMEEYDDVDVSVKLHPDAPEVPVAVELSLNGFRLSASMECEEAREIGQSIIDGADEVEAFREQNWDEADPRR